MKRYVLALITIVLLSQFSFGQKYFQVIKNSLESQNSDYGKFVWVTYPTNNYGILSMGNSAKSDFEIGQRHCPTFTCLGLSEDLISDRMLTIDENFVTLEEGDAASLDEDTTKASLIKASLPSFFGYLGLSGSLANSNTITIDLSFGGLARRTAKKSELIDYIKSLNGKAGITPTQRDIYKLYAKKRLSIVTEDLVIKSLEFRITLFGESDRGIEVSLEQNVGKIIGKDTTFKAEVKKVANKTYTITTNRPLIIARYYQNARDIEIN